MLRNNSSIKIDSVVEYWLNNDEDIFTNKPTIKLNLKSGQVTCFCCGDHRDNLEKAHIIPVSSGGSNNVDNIHILCKSCHLRTESFTDIPVIGNELYFNFIKQHPELFLLRQKITSKLISQNFELCSSVFGKEKNNIEYKVKKEKPILSNLSLYKKELKYWKNQMSLLIQDIMNGISDEEEIKQKAKEVRIQIEKYENLIKTG